GTTLYELSAIGVPMVAVPVVENQAANARGVRELGVGLSLDDTRWATDDVARAVGLLGKSEDLRRELSRKARTVVDGLGARRVYEAVARIHPTSKKG
ncbi:MAG: hypothetical protein E7003_07610, partial [Eggerthellaceae bacterium]|nr:hypothetical protein [Eggerthellaceae bacterium]